MLIIKAKLDRHPYTSKSLRFGGATRQGMSKLQLQKLEIGKSDTFQFSIWLAVTCIYKCWVSLYLSNFDSSFWFSDGNNYQLLYFHTFRHVIVVYNDNIYIYIYIYIYMSHNIICLVCVLTQIKQFVLLLCTWVACAVSTVWFGYGLTLFLWRI